MRVALLSRAAYPLHSPGGLERAVYHLAKHLRSNGVDTVLVTRTADADSSSFPGEVIEVAYGPEGARHGGVFDRTLRYPRFATRLGGVAADLVRGGRADVVHAQGLTALGYGRRRKLEGTLRAPLVMNPQGMEEHKTRGLKRLALTRIRWLSREAARLADRVVATDEATRNEVPLLLGVDPRRVVVLPNGIDCDEIQATTPANFEQVACAAIPELEAATLVLFSVGRLEGYKGFGDTLRALESVASALPAGWLWVVAGEGPDRSPLEQRASRDHVRFVGRVDDRVLHALYASADVFVHATRFEGSSLVTLEAMAHALPVVATRSGGIPDKVSSDSGRLVEPGDMTGLGKAIVELSSDAQLRRRLGQRGRERVLDEFSWPVLAKRTIAVYEELLGSAGR